MNRDEIFNKVKDVLCECFDDDELEITFETTASDVDGWDSLRHIIILTALEDEFNIRFPLKAVGNVKNVGDIVSMIEEILQ